MYNINKIIKNKLVKHLYFRYGINVETLENYEFIFKNKKTYIINNEKKEIILKILNNKRIESIGLEIFNDYKQYIPCSLGFTFFKAENIKENYVLLDREQTLNYFKQENILLENVKEKKILSNGYVIAIYNNKVVGTLYYDKEKNYLEPNTAVKIEKIY